jgi:3-hexulose-6-phosphate synthase
MRLQIAVDMNGKNELLQLAEKVHNSVDIIEVGTPMIILDGQNPVRALRKKYPDACILSDTKIMDGGDLEARYACMAGANIVTVLAVSDDRTIRGVISEAHKYSSQVMVDMINVPDISKRARQLDAMGADYICVHTAYDVQSTGKTPLAELEKVMAIAKNSKVAVAGGVNMKTIREIVRMDPEIIIIGGALASVADPRAAAKEYQKIIKG